MSAPVYATRSELYTLSISSAALTGVSTGDQDSALDAASRVADSYLDRRFSLPLKTWGIDLKQAVADIAAFRLLKARGFNPERGDAEQLRLSYEDAMKWLKDISKGDASPTGVTDSGQSGADATDDTGQQRIPSRVLQAGSTECVPGDFWGKGGCVTSQATKGRKRGW